ncbi:MAG: SU10 major capsid protein [Bacillota bacterium]
MSATGYIRTIEDLERLYYTKAGMHLLGEDDVVSVIAKADDPVKTTTTGVYNAIYGAQAWAQLNMEANAWGVLPKLPWSRSGWRVITDRSAGYSETGVAENATLPESTKPIFAQLSTKPKTMASIFEVSETQEYLTQVDDATTNMEQQRQYKMREHVEAANVQLLGDSGTVAGNNMESIDRIVGSNNELVNAKDATGAVFDANDLDIYGQDRDAGASWVDAQVVHNNGNLRILTDDLIRDVMYKTQNAGAESTFFLTGNDTANDITGLYSSQVRYIGEATVSGSVNGVQVTYGKEGIASGRRVFTIYGYPIIISKNTVTDTSSGKSRLYLLDASNPEGYDFSRLFIKVAKPTQYFEAGINSGTPFAINKFSDKGLFRTMSEVICTFFKVQGKVRDLG